MKNYSEGSNGESVDLNNHTAEINAAAAKIEAAFSRHTPFLKNPKR